ncbi:MAG: hypothetical protein IIC13_16395 [SAR324 cluster bacterium]|nr:hypothetical protein [SAR324 cluster bacterium]
MRNPVAPLTPEAVKAVDPVRPTPPREAIHSSRSFAELLAEADAVRDHVEIQYRGGAPGRGLPALLQGAWMMMANRMPGRMGLASRTKKSTRPLQSGG